MEKHLVKIKSIKHITPDVLQIVTEKPDNYTFASGQATEIAINKPGWKDKKGLSLSLPYLSMIFCNLPSKLILRTKE